MALSAGARLGPYEILAPIGAGGMGEVYRARDTKLDRDVAIKVLPEAVAQNPERLARFEREAKVLAALNHPNIAGIYGVEERAIVMELVEGDEIKGPLPIETALNYARQIADALEAAHEKAIVHRDLKPANIKVTADGVVKVLDFGLAAVVQGPAGDPGNSPTLTMGATVAGTILGTAAYMSPEQARGKAVDKRADIWAFGVVLWEMLTGRRLFDGEDVTETLASVVKDQADLTQVPVPVRRLLKKCLEKDPKRRLRDIGDVWELLQEEAPETVPMALKAPARSWFGIVATAAAIVFALVLAGLAFVHFRETLPVAALTRFQIPAPEKVNFGGWLAVSPDGRRVAFSAAGPGDGIFRVWVRSLDSLEARPLPGTEAQINALFWSPDSRSIAFGSLGKLKKVDVSGGPPQTLCDAPGLHGGSWNNEGVIIFGSLNAGLSRVAEAGGAASPLTALNSTRGEQSHRLPFFCRTGGTSYTGDSPDPPIRPGFT